MKFHAKPWTLPEGTHRYRKTHKNTHTYTLSAASERRSWCIQSETGKAESSSSVLLVQAAVAFNKQFEPRDVLMFWPHL